MLTTDVSTPAIPLIPLTPTQLGAWREQASSSAAAWLQLQGFGAKPGSVCMVPGADGAVECVLTGMASGEWLWSIAAAAASVKTGVLSLRPFGEPPSTQSLHLAALGFELATYGFTRYGKPSGEFAALHVPEGVNAQAVQADRDAVALTRDLINTAPQDMMPAQLQAAAQSLADEFGASLTAIVGDELLEQNFPAIHAVGRASAHAPRLIDLRWGADHHPRVTLVGKGVCFDSGGLDIKPPAGMRNMKKDMGGAAHVLGLARRIMSAQLPLRLRVLVPAVENAISGSAYHPGDVLATRAAKTVEVDNTDAEGRIVLCDALTEACSEQPEVILDFATLTGAARVALGTELPALFCNDDALADALLAAGREREDPIWRLPLHAPYRNMLDSRVADMVNSASGGFGGAITAALFLESFVDDGLSWAHFDLMAWNLKPRPGRPEGGEAMALRTCFDYLQTRFAAG